MKHSAQSIAEEYAYRRGFDQAMYVVIRMLERGESLEDIKKTKLKVYKWRQSGKYGEIEVRIAPPVKI